MPRRKELIYCLFCSRRHPQYYGAALKNHMEARGRAAQRGAQPEPEPQPQHESSPEQGASVTQPSQQSNQLPGLRILDIGNLNSRNIASKFLEIFDIDNKRDEFLLKRCFNADISEHQMGIEDQGARSLATLARNTLESKIDPLLQDQVMVPEMIDLRNAAIVQWPQSTPTHLPIHWSLVNTSLGKALLRDGVRAVKMLIALGVDANSMLPCGYRISGVAALTAAGKVIEYLLGVPEIRIDEKVNAYGHLEETAMVLAYKTSQLQIYGQFLAANGGIIPARTMLYICAIEPHATLISVIALNADVRKSIRTKHPVNHNTPLHAAVLNEDEQMLTTILELGRKTTTIINSFAVFLNATNSDGQTPLMLAVEHKMRDAVTTLLEQEGIEVNARAAGGRTALWYAARVLDVDLCNTLRHFGADEGNPAPGRQMWTTKGTPFNALLEAYDQAHEEFTHNKNRLEANANFERAKNKIERIGWLLDSIGSNPNLPDHYTLRVPRNTVLENFPEWQDIFT